MVTFKCPVCKLRHSVPTYEAKKDYICRTNRLYHQTRKSNNAPNPAALTKKGYNKDHFSTRIDEYRDWTILPADVKEGVKADDRWAITRGRRGSDGVTRRRGSPRKGRRTAGTAHRVRC